MRKNTLSKSIVKKVQVVSDAVSKSVKAVSKNVINSVSTTIADYESYRTTATAAAKTFADKHPVVSTVYAVGIAAASAYAANPEFWDKTISETTNRVKEKLAKRNNNAVEEDNKTDNSKSESSGSSFHDSLFETDATKDCVMDTEAVSSDNSKSESSGSSFHDSLFEADATKDCVMDEKCI